jgi:hypothetical protein
MRRRLGLDSLAFYPPAMKNVTNSPRCDGPRLFASSMGVKFRPPKTARPGARRDCKPPYQRARTRDPPSGRY